MGEKNQQDEAVCSTCTGQRKGHSDKGQVPADWRNTERFSGEERKDFLILLFLFSFVWLWVFICSCFYLLAVSLVTTENVRSQSKELGIYRAGLMTLRRPAGLDRPQRALHAGPGHVDTAGVTSNI